MQQFTQKYAVIQLLEPMPVGSLFSSRQWPLHTTVVDTFAVDWDTPTLIDQLARALQAAQPATTTAQDDTYFGSNQDIQVTLLERSRSIVELHTTVIHALMPGGWQPNDPHYAGDGFRPHATVQPHARLTRGDTIHYDALSLIDFFPSEDPYMRRVLATLPIG